eukprot:gene28835-38125_t
MRFRAPRRPPEQTFPSGRLGRGMAERMLKFTIIDRRTPEKREARERDRDFHEIYADFIDAKATEQASRCSQCGVPFCQTHCPLHNNIPDWLRLTAAGRLEEAYRLSQATNAMPEICGRICPQDRLCEGNCVIEQSGHGTVTIGAVERYLTDKAWEEGWVKPLVARADLGQSVGIVGAGPAGLATAEILRELGYAVTVYDRHDRAGGLLIYGIPGFKLEKDVVERRTQRLADGGVEFRLNFEVGRGPTLQSSIGSLAYRGRVSMVGAAGREPMRVDVGSMMGDAVNGILWKQFHVFADLHSREDLQSSD